eukprot:98825_1
MKTKASFSTQSWHDGEGNSVCINCNTKTKANKLIRWPKCAFRHKYCTQCFKDHVNQSLSVLNEVPTCMHQDCDQILNIAKAKLHFIISKNLKSRYEITTTFEACKRNNNLMFGFTRNIQHIPTEIVFIILDYYDLDYSQSVPCNDCILWPLPDVQPLHKYSAFSEYMLSASEVQSREWATKWNECCDLKLLNEESVNRFAKYKSISRRPCHRFDFDSFKNHSLIQVNPRHQGWKRGIIRRFDQDSAQVQIVYNDNDGRQRLYWTHLDNCSEIRALPETIQSFSGPCPTCNDQKYLMTLDLQRLCKRQLLCVKCKEYYPTKYIIYWSCCCHVVCVECLLPLVKDEITKIHRIPVCPHTNCANEIQQNNAWYLYELLRDNNDEFHLKRQLQILFDIKDSFKCSYCLEWHANKDMFVDERRDCNHDDKYSVQCRNEQILFCGHSDCVHCSATCEVCLQSTINLHLIPWAICGHKYHRKCAQKYMNEWIPEKKSVFNANKNTFLIPLCISRDCKQLVDVQCAAFIGATQYQCQMLRYLAQQRYQISRTSAFL